MTDKYLRAVVACRSLQPELDALLAQKNKHNVYVHYLDQNLHRTPDVMPAEIQTAVNEVAALSDGPVVLGYGLCSNGIVGVVAPRQGLIVPRVHDCIALFLGSRQAYLKAFQKRPGAYYLTPGWVAEEKDPLGFMENDYVPRVGREEAAWGAKEELKHYTHIVLINTQAAVDRTALRDRARENSRFFNKQLLEVDGASTYFEKLLFGPYDGVDETGVTNFVRVAAGDVVAQKPFLDM
jgi:hypothetical protein